MSTRTSGLPLAVLPQHGQHRVRVRCEALGGTGHQAAIRGMVAFRNVALSTVSVQIDYGAQLHQKLD
jgi:hypothetical protein